RLGEFLVERRVNDDLLESGLLRLGRQTADGDRGEQDVRHELKLGRLHWGRLWTSRWKNGGNFGAESGAGLV
ncbi:MAG: hypothetical protein V3V75_08955, partial [Thermoguttaceae bacterium]